MKRSQSRVLIVGAGIAGLLAAVTLQRAGVSVKVLEKGRGFGGRMATRRMAGGRLDHGAQFFTVRTPEFGVWVEEWLEKGWIREWFREAPWDSTPGGHPRYVGISGMTEVPKGLGAELDVERSVRVESTRWDGNRWRVKVENGETYETDTLIVTAPVPQAVALLDGSRISLPAHDWTAIQAVGYEPCLTALLVLDGPSGLPEPGGVKLSGEPIEWLGDNTRKGISPGVSTVTVHSTPAFAREYWDAPDDERLPLLQEAAEVHLGSTVVEGSVHRWKFNVPLRGLDCGYYWSSEYSLGLAGDGFGGPRVEGSAVSGLKLGQFLVSECL
ncbi:MAG: FAD-dependent oxidoreductase [Verrucomicrobiota bacterium]